MTKLLWLPAISKHRTCFVFTTFLFVVRFWSWLQKTETLEKTLSWPSALWPEIKSRSSTWSVTSRSSVESWGWRSAWTMNDTVNRSSTSRWRYTKVSVNLPVKHFRLLLSVYCHEAEVWYWFGFLFFSVFVCWTVLVTMFSNFQPQDFLVALGTGFPLIVHLKPVLAITPLITQTPWFPQPIVRTCCSILLLNVRSYKQFLTVYFD